MKTNQNILKIFDFEGFTVNINSKKLSNKRSIFIKNEVKDKIDIDNLYFSGEYASVYFKTIKKFDNNTLSEICKIHKSIWNQRKVPFLYVSTPTELRIYNCFEEPIDPNVNLKAIDNLELLKYSINDTEQNLKNLVSLFSRISIDSGEFWKDELTTKFSSTKRVDNVLVKNLKDTKSKLERNGIPTYIIHELLTRSLFILYLEDTGATDEYSNDEKNTKSYFDNFKKGARSYFDILKDKDATYRLFESLKLKFNGNLFTISDDEKTIITDKTKSKITETELGLIASCFWGNEVGSGQKTIWKKFDFSVIPVELLSQIYEIFLNKTDKEKSKSGEYYTPHSLVDLILNESLPWADEDHKTSDLKILDIACGSGIFLVESYRRLIDRWIYTNKKQPEFHDLKNILVNSIFGFEINKESIKVASFSLYLALISYLNPKTIWQKKHTKFPHLIFDPKNKDKENQGKNLFLLSSISNSILEQPTFDLVVGNPPFKSAKSGSITPESHEYCERYGFAKEMVLPFLHRASQFCNKKGWVSMVSTSKILFNTLGGYPEFRKFLFEDNYVETVFNFSALRKSKKGQGTNVFADAVGPSCVLFYKNNFPEKQNIKQNITYVCPKPKESDLFSDKLVLDALDFYYLPREECQKKDTVIWKTAMWGTDNDFQLIQSMLKKRSLNQYLTKQNDWHKGGGFQFLSNDREKTFTGTKISKYKIMPPANVQRYYTSENNLIDFKKSLSEKNILYYLKKHNCKKVEDLPRTIELRMLGEETAFEFPHVFIKKGQSKGKFTSSYINFYSPYKDGIYGISFDKKGLSKNDFIIKDNILKALVAYLNSKITSYYLFLTSTSWGVEREQIMFKEIKELPALPFEIPQEQVAELAKKTDEISAELSKDYSNDIIVRKIESEIDKIIYKVLNLTIREQFLIEDVLNYSLDLFQEGENSPAYFPVNEKNDELKSYLEIICEDINEHLQFSDATVWASIQEIPVTITMKLVAIHFTEEYKKNHIKTYKHSENINKLINKIDKYSYKKHSASVYFRKVVKYFSGDIIYIIKPNQKRFWSRSQAMQDSSSILLEIANMEEK